MVEKEPLEEAMEEAESELKTLVDMSDELMPTFYGPSFPSPSIDKNGHIFVTLELIPVEERLPEVVDAEYPCLRMHPSYSQPELVTLWWLGQWEDNEGVCENEHYRVTHWAEIPKTQHNAPIRT